MICSLCKHQSRVRLYSAYDGITFFECQIAFCQRTIWLWNGMCWENQPSRIFGLGKLKCSRPITDCPTFALREASHD